jgi:hypothetical protein
MTTLVRDSNASAIPVLRPTTTSAVSVSGTAASQAITGTVTRIVSDTKCHYSLVGTATVSSVMLPAFAVEYVHTYEGDTLSVITSGATGTVYVTNLI